MFTSFNLKLNPANDFRDYYDDGNEYLSEKQQKLQNELELLICSDSKIDGTAVQNNWFPEVNASVFCLTPIWMKIWRSPLLGGCIKNVELTHL